MWHCRKSYNNGDIYNGFNVVGGVVGYWYNGYLKNVFNTGNITVFNKNNGDSQVGGIVGSVELSGGNFSSGSNTDMSISNAIILALYVPFKVVQKNATQLAAFWVWHIIEAVETAN